ncbi:MAG: hypothetical protein V4655_00670, partial [Bdellovibrionota bacterium]
MIDSFVISKLQRRLGKETVIPPLSSRELSEGLFSHVFVMRPHVRFFIVGLALISALFGLVGPYCQKLFVDAILKDFQ